jgi:hypothetical protein
MTRAMTILLAAALAAASLAGCSRGGDTTSAAPVAHDAQDPHDAHGTQEVAVARPEGGLWPTDEALRAGMSRIEAAVEQASVPLSGEHAGELARTVEENVTFIVKNCKLPPEPDAALHVLIGRMMTAASQLKDETTSGAGVAQLVRALHDYRATFDHATAPAQ